MLDVDGSSPLCIRGMGRLGKLTASPVVVLCAVLSWVQ